MAAEVLLLLVAIGLISFLAGFIHSAVGFGFGIVAISLLPFVIDARTAHVVVSMSSVPMLIMAAWAYREGIEWASLKQALIGAAIFLPLGLLVFELVSLDWLVRGTGVAILVMVLLSLRKRPSNCDAQPVRASCFAAGAAGGFLAGAVSIAGPPVAAFALKQDWPQRRFKAFVTQCLLVISIYKAGLLTVRDYFVGDAIWQTVIASLLAILGVQIGALVSRRISALRFRRLVAAGLILVSCLMIGRGQRAQTDETSQLELSQISVDSDASSTMSVRSSATGRYPEPFAWLAPDASTLR